MLSVNWVMTLGPPFGFQREGPAVTHQEEEVATTDAQLGEILCGLGHGHDPASIFIPPGQVSRLTLGTRVLPKWACPAKNKL